MLKAALEAASDASALDRARALNSLTALTYFSGDLPGTAGLVQVVVDLVPAIPQDVVPREYAETLFFLAVGCAVTGQPELTTRVTDQILEYCEKHKLDVMVPAAWSVRTVALLKAAQDPETMRTHADELQRNSRGWTKGWANLMIGELYLKHPDLAPDSGERALAALRVALTRFLHHEDYPHALNTLRIGALALARVGRPLDDATRLLAAVQAHAERLGLRTPGLGPVAEGRRTGTAHAGDGGCEHSGGRIRSAPRRCWRRWGAVGNLPWSSVERIGDDAPRDRTR